jgi:hypothetical protein
MEIPLKAKYRPQDKLYGYARRHNGNNAKKIKKGIVYPAVYSHNRDEHVLLVDAKSGHTVMKHHAEARDLLDR